MSLSPLSYFILYFILFSFCFIYLFTFWNLYHIQNKDHAELCKNKKIEEVMLKSLSEVGKEATVRPTHIFFSSLLCIFIFLLFSFLPPLLIKYCSCMDSSFPRQFISSTSLSARTITYSHQPSSSADPTSKNTTKQLSLKSTQPTRRLTQMHDPSL